MYEIMYRILGSSLEIFKIFLLSYDEFKRVNGVLLDS